MMVSAYPRQENYHLAPHLMVSAAKHDTHITSYSFYSYCWHRGWNGFLQIDIATKMLHDITHYLSMLYNRIQKRY